MSDLRKEWWAPVWCGLVADPQGKHVKRLGMAGWLLLYLIVHAQRASGIVITHRATIARRTGVSLRTIQRWLARLRRHAYIEIVADRPSLKIQVKRWKHSRTARQM